jgi:Na+-transporting NADH:ubiquinone oxidoreductase subunit NqrE
VVVINVPLVWGVDLVATYLARFVDLGFGLIAVYLTVVNALVHILAAVRFREYNPGLATAVVLFLPLGIWALVAVSAAPGVGIGYHALGLGFAVLTHIAIAVHVLRRARALKAA